jgi:NADH-quinone oxidoreductase subunit E
MSGTQQAITIEEWQQRISERFKPSAEMLIPVLQHIQSEFGYLPPEAISASSRHLRVSEARVFGVASFYAQFRLEPVGRFILKVCHGTACHVGGASGLTDALCDHLGVKDGGTTEDMQYTVDSVACVGCCSLAPVMMVGNSTHGRLDRKKVVKLLDEYR